MSGRHAALRRLQKKNPDLRPGGLRAALRAINERFGLDFDAETYRAGFVPFATWWDPKHRTLHIYELEGRDVILPRRLRCIQTFGHDLHAASGCYTKLWICDTQGHSPLPVWDVRDELMSIYQPTGEWLSETEIGNRRRPAHLV